MDSARGVAAIVVCCRNSFGILNKGGAMRGGGIHVFVH